MIKQLPKWSTLMRSPSAADHSASASPCPSENIRLGAIDRIERLVQEKANGKGPIDPCWHILVHCWVVPEHGQEVDDNEAEAR